MKAKFIVILRQNLRVIQFGTRDVAIGLVQLQMWSVRQVLMVLRDRFSWFQASLLSFYEIFITVLLDFIMVLVQ